MRRRAVLAAAVAAVVAGCGSRGDTDATDVATDTGATTSPAETPAETTSRRPTTRARSTTAGRRYEQCPREVIRFETFPEPIQREIEAALDGRYAASRVYLAEAMDTERSYVLIDGTFYDPMVRIEMDREILELRRVEPKALPEPRPIRVESGLSGERRIRISVIAEAGAVLLDETRTVRPGGRVEFGSIRRVGTHEVKVGIGDSGADATRTVRISTPRVGVTVVIDNSGIELQLARKSRPRCPFTR